MNNRNNTTLTSMSEINHKPFAKLKEIPKKNLSK